MNRVLQHRMVPDPMISDAEYLHQRAKRPGSPNVGKVLVQENAMTRIGALCFIRKRLTHQEMAAERFKSEYEALFGSGVPALDNARPVVDRSPVAHDSGMAAKLDRGASVLAAMDHMSKAARDRLVACLVLCIPCGEGEHWRTRARNIDALLSDLDTLSGFYGYKMEAA